jgi:hypothetical protein
MNKRISIVNERTLLCEIVFVLTESQREKLESGKLREKIDHIALDMHVCWSVEVNGNTTIGLIGRECWTVIDSDTMHQIEIDATNFMGAVDKLELPVNEDVIHFDDSTELDFVKQLLTDLNLPKEDEDSVIGAQILCYGPKNIPFPLPWGKMSSDLLKEMCELYIKAHE